MVQMMGLQLGIDGLMSEEIRENDDRIVCLLVFRVGKVCADLIPVSDMGVSSLMKYYMNLLSSMFWISPLASPSCLTPMVQHWPGGLDAILPETRVTHTVVVMASTSMAKRGPISFKPKRGYPQT